MLCIQIDIAVSKTKLFDDYILIVAPQVYSNFYTDDRRKESIIFRSHITMYFVDL